MRVSDPNLWHWKHLKIHESPRIQALTPTSAPTMEPTQRSEPAATFPRLSDWSDMAQRSLVEPNEKERTASVLQL